MPVQAERANGTASTETPRRDDTLVTCPAAGDDLRRGGRGRVRREGTGLATFLPGLTLSRLFYAEAVRPVLDRRFPRLPHAAALIGPGSEVLGVDTPRSTDHHWGPRLQLFLRAEEIGHRAAVAAALAEELPPSFRGFSTHFGPPDEVGVRLRAAIDSRRSGPGSPRKKRSSGAPANSATTWARG